MKLVAAKFCVKAAEATDCVAATAVATASEKVADVVALLASVTVIVKVVAASAVVGVPVIAPVAGLRLRPVGSDGETL